MAFFGYGIPLHCLDEEFDEPDLVADLELCRAIAVGRRGPHPDVWGNHDPLTTLPPQHRRCEPEPPPPPVVHAPVDQVRHWWLLPPPVWVPAPEPAIDDSHGGTIELTCDDCGVRFKTLTTYAHGHRAHRATQLRALGAKEGWTHIVGRDRCPACSGIPPPNDVGDGAGKREREEQHADGG